MAELLDASTSSSDSSTNDATLDSPAAAVHRRKVISELIQTETTYISHIKLLCHFFGTPLKLSNILPLGAFQIIFANLPEIVQLNEQLLRHLRKEEVGQAFLKLSPFLKLYTDYVRNHERAIQTLQQQTERNKKFAEFRRLQEAKPEMKGLKLNALLIMPVQRIPRYCLLLGDLVRHTPPTHKDYAALEVAVKQVSQVAEHINSHIEQQENFQTMLAIQNRFSGDSAPKIILPGRRFLREGVLNKVSRQNGRVQPRTFFLFSDILIYAKQTLIPSSTHRFTCSCVLPLRHMSVDLVPSTCLPSLQAHSGVPPVEELVKIVCIDETLFVFAEDPQQSLQWKNDLETAIHDTVSKRRTLRKESSRARPMRRQSIAHQKRLERRNPVSSPRKADERSKLQVVAKVPGTGQSCVPPSTKTHLIKSLRHSPLCISPICESPSAAEQPKPDDTYEKEIPRSEHCVGRSLTSPLSCISSPNDNIAPSLRRQHRIRHVKPEVLVTRPVATPDNDSPHRESKLTTDACSHGTRAFTNNAFTPNNQERKGNEVTSAESSVNSEGFGPPSAFEQSSQCLRSSATCTPPVKRLLYEPLTMSTCSPRQCKEGKFLIKDEEEERLVSENENDLRESTPSSCVIS